MTETGEGVAQRASTSRGDFWKDALRRRLLAAADLLAVLTTAAAIAATGHAGPAVWVAASAPLWLLVAKLRGLYDRDHRRLGHTTLDESSALFHWAALCATATGLTAAALSDDEVAVGVALLLAFTPLATAFALRATARALWRRLVPRERGLVLGSGTIADDFARRVELGSGHHLELVARLDLSDGGAADGHLDRLEELVADHGVERVILALHDLSEETLSRVVSGCRALGVKLSVAPPMRAMLGTAVELNHLAELPLIEFRTWDPSRSTMLLKRGMDVVGSGVALTLLSPFLALVALAIRLDSRGPALFRQRRAGRGGTEFGMLKFRTMSADAAERVSEVVALETLDDPMFKLRADPRVTRIGRLLRRSSIDELPQLVNVLRGEMSLVGPRPEETWLVERYEEADRFRLEMRPGMTGPMQVHGRGELTFQERASVEREYVENYSLRKDVKILFQTVYAVLSGRGAF